MTDPEPTSPPTSPPTPKPTAPELLARALEHLTSDERQQVTAWFLTRSLAASARSANQELLRTLLPGPESFRELYARGSTAGGQQIVPIRLPAEVHSRLRLWCTEHGFSMATVIRGLVGRFLDGQAES